MERTLADVQLSYPWALLTCATAAVIAYLADNDGARFGRWLRLIEGLTVAVATALIAYVTYRWRQSIGSPAAQKSQFLFSVLPLTAVNGFLLGYVVPTRHRNAAQLRRFSRGDDGDDGLSASLLRFEQRVARNASISAQDVSATP